MRIWNQGYGSVLIFFRIRIRIQHLRMDTNPDPDPIRIQGFNDKKLKKYYSWKFIFIFLWSKTAIYLSLGLHKVCTSYRRSLQLSKEAIQHFKTWTFTNFFSTFVGNFCPPGSGSGFRIRIRIHRPDWIRIQSGSGSTTLSGTSIFSYCGSRGLGSSCESRVLMTKNWKKLTAVNFFIFFGSKIEIYLSLCLHKGRTSYRRSLQPSKENIQATALQNMKILYFYLCLWVIFALLNPDSDPHSKCGSGSSNSN
jgi:hypothetical protein